MNTPVNAQQMEDFRTAQAGDSIGGKTFMGRDNNGVQMYYPNRKERRAGLSQRKRNNRKRTNGRNRF